MFDVDAAKAILDSGLLRVVRKTLFTSTKDPKHSTSAFDFDAFYQHGTAVVLQSHGMVYLLTPSHVVRNATQNNYQNDSPVWATVRHEQVSDVSHFLLPMRFYDLSPDGETSLDAAVLEINPFIIGGLPDFLDWDNEDLFCKPDDDVYAATAVVAGYPEEANPYEFVEQEDGSVLQIPTIRLTTFLGMISRDVDDRLVFLNFMHQDAYEYAGLSGGVVVCAIGGKPRYLGIVVSRGDGGRRFSIVSFADIRAALRDLRNAPWEVVDEAYFLGHPTHAMMTFQEFEADFMGRATFVQRRSNVFLEQLVRTMKAPPRPHWVCNLQGMHDELRVQLGAQLAQCLRKVVALRNLE